MCQTSCARSPGNTRAATAKSVACALGAPPPRIGGGEKEGDYGPTPAPAPRLGTIWHVCRAVLTSEEEQRVVGWAHKGVLRPSSRAMGAVNMHGPTPGHGAASCPRGVS